MPIKPFQKTALVAALMVEITTAQAATIEVDNSNCTLADAITAANNDTATGGCSAGSGDDVINLPNDSTISLTEALPAIINNVTINANGSTIERDTTETTQFSVITGGNLATLPTIEINDATIKGGAYQYNNGGGINIFSGSLLLNNSVVSSNIGGGVSVVNGELSEINNSQITNNITSSDSYATFYGGGLSVSDGSMTISNTTINNNNSMNPSPGGGGIYITSFSGPTNLTIINSTISNNTAESNGGGINITKDSMFDVQVTKSNITVVKNSAADGGGIYNNDAVISIGSSIISGNTATGTANSIYSQDASVVSSQNNLLGLNSNAGLSGVTQGSGDIIPSKTNLSDIIDITLADNGGNTPTHNLAVGSPAIDAIAGPCDQATDQVGNARPADGDGDMTAACDIGAVEFQPGSNDIIFVNGFEPPN